MESLGQMLAPGEKILASLRFSAWGIAGRLAADAAALAASLGLLWFDQTRLAGFAALAVAAALCAWTAARFFNNRVWITDRRLVAQTGWPGRDVLDFPYERFESATVHQGLAGRMLGYGDIRIAGVGSTVATLPMMGSPLAFKKELDTAKARTASKLAQSSRAT